LHDSAQPRFAFESPLEDLAREIDVPTAAFATKRVEYRGSSLQLDGAGWPLLLILEPLLIGGLGVGLARWIFRGYDRRQQQCNQEARDMSLAPAGSAQ
jgi:AraC family transcriptional activator FtrA